MELKDSDKRTTGMYIKKCDVLGVTRIFKFHYNPPGSSGGGNGKSLFPHCSVIGMLTMSPPKEKFVTVLDYAFANIPTLLCESVLPLKGKLPGSKMLEEEDLEGSLSSSRISRMSSRWETPLIMVLLSSVIHVCLFLLFIFTWLLCAKTHIICIKVLYDYFHWLTELLFTEHLHLHVLIFTTPSLGKNNIIQNRSLSWSFIFLFFLSRTGLRKSIVSLARRPSRAGNWWVRDRDHHSLSPRQVTHLPPVWDFLFPWHRPQVEGTNGF